MSHASLDGSPGHWDIGRYRPFPMILPNDDARADILAAFAAQILLKFMKGNGLFLRGLGGFQDFVGMPLDLHVAPLAAQFAMLVDQECAAHNPHELASVE